MSTYSRISARFEAQMKVRANVADVDFNTSNANAGATGTTVADEESDECAAMALVKDLSSAADLEAQVKVVRNHKAAIRNALKVDRNARIILQLYLDTRTEALRRYFDWAIDFMLNNGMREVIKSSCLRMWSWLKKEGVTIQVMEVSKLMELSSSAICMCTLHKDVAWLLPGTTKMTSNVGDGEDLCSKGDALLEFVRFLIDILARYHKIIRFEWEKNQRDGASIMGPAESFGELCRSLTILLNSNFFRKCRILNKTSIKGRAWLGLVDTVITLGIQTLYSHRIIGKDVTSAQAAALMCFSRLPGAPSDQTDRLPTLQLLYLTAAIVDRGGIDERAQQALTELNVDVGFLPRLASGVSQLPVIARLALLRGALSMYSPQELDVSCKDVAAELQQHDALVSALPTSPQTEEAASILVGFVLPGILSRCTSSQPPSLQLFAVQSLESWLNSLEVVLKSRDVDVKTEKSVERLKIELDRVIGIAPVLMTVWRHPSKLVNHVASSLFQRLCDTLSIILAHAQISPEEQMSRVWSTIIQVALRQPIEHRSRYHAITLLVPRVGAAALVESQTRIFEQLLSAMRLKEVSSSCCSCIASLLRSLVCEQAPVGFKSKGKGCNAGKGAMSVDSHGMVCNQAKCQQYRELWVTPFVRMLCPALSGSSPLHHEQNLADYLLPELLKVDSLAVPTIVEGLRQRIEESGPQRVLWALVHTCLHARLLGVPGKEVIESPEAEEGTAPLAEKGPLRLYELKAACQGADTNLRLSALTALTASLQSSRIDRRELSVLKDCFGLTMKLGATDETQKLLRVIKALCVRTLESTRVAMKAAAKVEKKLRSKSGERATPTENDAAILTACEKAIASCREVFSWLQSQVQSNLYPGATFDRELLGLRIVQCAFNFVGVRPSTDFAPLLSSPLETAIISGQQVETRAFSDSCDPALTAICPFFTESVTHSLLNAFVSSWDKSRRLASELLTLFPRPLPGYASSESVASLSHWAIRLASSARQRESDAGALMVKVIFSVYALREGWRLRLPLGGENVEDESPAYSDQVGQSTMNAKDDIVRIQVMQMNIAGETLEETGGLRVHLAQRLRACAKSTYLQSFPRESGSCAGIIAVLDLIQCLEERSSRLETLFGQISTSPEDGKEQQGADGDSQAFPLCHGLLLAMRYCVLEAVEQGFLRDDSSAAQSSLCAASWRYAIRRLTSFTHGALRVALTVVAEASTDVAFAPSNAQSNAKSGATKSLLPAGGSAVDNVCVKGPINSTQDSGMAATYLNANSTATTYGEEGAGAEDGDTSLTQMCVVGAWMLVREAAATLAVLVEISPPPCASSGAPATGFSQSGKDENMQLLSVSDVSNIGTVLLSALGRLKHMGAIAEVQSALNSVTATLLRYGGRCEELSCLPLQWMSGVLDRLHSKKQVFILRRSAGFAYTFIALLRAEPKNVATNLLPLALGKLLGFAEKGMSVPLKLASTSEEQAKDGPDWSTCVHALNALRLILVDATLGAEVDPYIPKATVLAVRGFRHGQWGVRNSSMMLFSSVLQRAVDNDKRSVASHRGTTAKDFFARFPSLFCFLLEELAAVTSHKVRVSAKSGQPQAVYFESGGEHADEDRPPTLYPILLLLSKFRVDQDLERGQDDSQLSSRGDLQLEADLALFVPLLEQASRKAEQKIRLAAAGALAALTPSLKVLQSVKARLVALSVSWQSMSTNALHGQLLMSLAQCHGLMTESVLAGLDTEEINSLVNPLKSVLELLSVGPKQKGTAEGRSYRCPPVLRIYLELVRTLIGLVSEERLPSWRLLQRQACEVALQPMRSKHAFLLPYEPLLWKEALSDLSVVVTVALQQDKDDMAGLVALLDHPLSEVRCGVLEGLLAALQAVKSVREWEGSAMGYNARSLLDRLLSRLELEKEAPLLLSALELIHAVSQKASDGTDLPGEGRLSSREEYHWVQLKKLVLTNEEGAALRLGAGAVVGGALLVMGWLLLSSSLSDIDYVLRAGEWVAVLEAAIGEDQPGYIREAAAQAMLTSRVHTRLVPELQGAASLRCRLWLVTLSVLQDEDEDVRQWGSSYVESNHRLWQEGEVPGVSRGGHLAVADELAQERIVRSLARDLVLDAQDSDPNEGHERVLALRDSLLVPFSSIRALMCSDPLKAGNEKVFEEEQANLYAERLVVIDSLNAALVMADVELFDLVKDSSGRYTYSVLDLLLTQACEAADIVLSCSKEGADFAELRSSLSGGLTFNREVYLTCSSALKAGRMILNVGIDIPSATAFSEKVEGLIGITAHPLLLEARQVE